MEQVNDLLEGEIEARLGTRCSTPVPIEWGVASTQAVIVGARKTAGVGTWLIFSPYLHMARHGHNGMPCHWGGPIKGCRYGHLRRRGDQLMPVGGPKEKTAIQLTFDF